ncbi:MAG: glucosylglycerol hydrolase, partial [Balneolaceae bacterium]
YSQLIQEKLQRGIKSSNADFFAHYLGAHPDGNSARFLFWHSDIETARSAELQLFIPSEYLLYDKPEQHANVTYYAFPADRQGPFASVVIDHLPAGHSEVFGALYQLQIINEKGEQKIIRDPMAWSMPFGIYAPAEYYDIEEVLSSRKDSEYFKQLSGTFEAENNRIQPSVNLLEIHTATTTKTGTLQSLSNRYRQIGAAIQNGQALSADEQNLIGFDAIELMPISPVIEHPGNHHFWTPIQNNYNQGENVTVKLKKPSVTNWGYDITIFGAAAVNPSILSTGRPHELLELIETLHNFPGQPIKVVLDVVYGHANNQALELLTDEFFAGSNVYGKNINLKHPLVRASILEIHRRKMRWGFDGVRVDSAQNFKVYDRINEQMICDDKFLNDLSETTAEVSGVKYKPWMIFEDGRPWPRDDWKLASTYREITNLQGHPFQWAPTIFAYNTPYNYTYWVSKWWRILEVLDFGEKWISGYANHDNMRRGTQADPSLINVNHQLGNSLKMVMDNAFNNPATTLLMNCFLPGVPMDFAHALGSTPWSFIRNTDTDS